MKNSKQIKEDIESLAIEARGIYEAAERSKRDMTQDESDRFQEITKKEAGGLIHELQKELSQAEERERAMREITVREKRRSTIDELGEIINPTQEPDRVLPTNGLLPAQQREPVRVYQRTAKLKAFKCEKDAYDCGMWLRAMVARAYNRQDERAEQHIRLLGWQISNAGMEGSGPAGGYTVPAPLSQTIIDVRESVGVARRAARIMPMTADTLSMARRDGGLTVFYPGETQLIPTSDKTWGQIELIAKKRAVAHQISQELQDDSIISIVDDAVNEMAYALASKEDAEFINGDGTSAFGGVMGVLASIGSAAVVQAATGHDTWAELDIGDFTAAMGRLPDKYSRMPVWITSANFYWSSMVNVMATGGGNAIADLQSGATAPRFLGFPVLWTDQMPRTSAASQISALFGTFEMGVLLGDRTGVRMARSDDYAFLEDMTTLKATTRYDIQVHAPGDDTDVGAYVALETAS